MELGKTNVHSPDRPTDLHLIYVHAWEKASRGKYSHTTMASNYAATANQREFLPGAREKLLSLLEHEKGSSAAATASPHELLWSGVLGVVLEGAKAQNDWGLATALVKAGAEFGALDLHAAVEEDQQELAAALLASEASVDAEDEFGETALYKASQQNNAVMAQLLLQKGAKVDTPNEYRWTPLFRAAAGGFPAVVRVLMASGADPSLECGDTLPLEKAVELEHLAVVRVMIELGVDVNAVAPNGGWTALHFAVGKIMVDMLVEAGADVEARDSVNGATPLNLQYPSGDEGPRIETVRALVDHGADVNTRDRHGNTPLHSIAGGIVNLGVVDFLLRSGADETIINNNGETALDTAGAHPERLRTLLVSAPVDRAWRRRGVLLLCVCRSRKDQLLSAERSQIVLATDVFKSSSIGPTGSVLGDELASNGWAGVAVWLSGLEDGQEGIFRVIVGYL